MPTTVEEARTRGNDAHVITKIRPKLNRAEGVIADAGQPRSGQFGSDRVADTVRFETVVIERRVLIRDCLVRCLKDSMRNDVIGSFSTVEEWLKERSLTPASPVIVLCSAERTEAEVDRDVALLSQADAGISIVILSDREDAGSVLNALDKGARGYITTSMAFDVAVHAIRLVRAGGTFVPARTLITSRVSIEKLPSESEKVRDSLFTARQAMVVESLRQGKANKIIAYERNMCESTVKVHVRNIMKKLGARNRTEVAFMMNGMEGKTQQAEFSKSRIACCNQLSAALPASRRLGPQPTLDHHRP
jgi:DNA-binding NarL/FixJ family response regulator